MPVAPGPLRRTSRPGVVALVVCLVALVGGAVAVLVSTSPRSPSPTADRVRSTGVMVPGDLIDPLPAPSCTRYAGPDGDDGALGTADQPLGSVQALVDGLSAGESGCLLPGTYSGDVRIAAGGAPGRAIVLTSGDPSGARPRLEGRIIVEDSANHVVISGLTLDGRNDAKLPSPTINGDDVVLRNNEITNDNFGICINLGHPSFGTAVGTVIEGNRVHRCGERPVTNLEHGIYVGTARDTLIRNNVIDDNADRGVQLYPDSQGTRVVNNVIVGNGTGVIFSGADGTVSSDNYVAQNIITASVRFNIDAFWSHDAGGVGRNNVVENNCLASSGISDISGEPGFTAADNQFRTPEYLAPADGDYRLRPGSPCSGFGPEWSAP